MSRRNTVSRSALEVLAHDGLHGLTHRRVDRRAGLPPGSTSNVFRTRGALLLGIAEEIAREADHFPDREHTLEEFTIALGGWIQASVTRQADRNVARYWLFLESRTDPELYAAVCDIRDNLVKWLDGLIATCQPPPAPSASELFEAVDGAVLQQICFPDGDFDAARKAREIVAGR